MPIPIRSYVLPDKHPGDSCEQRSAFELCIENAGFGKLGIELANDPHSRQRWCYSDWLYLQQPMKWSFINCGQKQEQACLVDLS